VGTAAFPCGMEENFAKPLLFKLLPKLSAKTVNAVFLFSNVAGNKIKALSIYRLPMSAAAQRYKQENVRYKYWQF
jgi:hypothetical protein